MVHLADFATDRVSNVINRIIDALEARGHRLVHFGESIPDVTSHADQFIQLGDLIILDPSQAVELLLGDTDELIILRANVLRYSQRLIGDFELFVLKLQAVLLTFNDHIHAGNGICPEIVDFTNQIGKLLIHVTI